MVESEYRKLVDAAAKRERNSRGLPDEERVYYAALPASLTPRQKLDAANRNSTRPDSWLEPELTDKERGMSVAAFNALPASVRNAIWNKAVWDRRQNLGG